MRIKNRYVKRRNELLLRIEEEIRKDPRDLKLIEQLQKRITENNRKSIELVEKMLKSIEKNRK